MPGNNSKIKIVEQRVPCDNVLHILAAIWDENTPTISVTIIKIDDDVKMV